MTTRRSCGALVVAALLVLPTACVELPDSGPVTTAEPDAEQSFRPANYINPPPPQPGAPQPEIVNGFLEAMRAYPSSTRVARQYLASGFRDSWDPTRQTITYGKKSTPQGRDSVSVDLRDADLLDGGGRWLGPIGGGANPLGFHLVKERGEWRIDRARDALVVPQTWFEERFVQKSLYFFDASADVLVPEPVFVPRGPQLATSLIQGLLAGPGGVPSRASLRTFFPEGATPGLSVPVRNDVADVNLSGGSQPSDPRRLVAQLVWTLRQDESIQEVRLSIGGRQIPLSGGRTQVSVDGSPEYDPAGFGATTALFGLRFGVVVTGATAAALKPVTGPFGELQIRALRLRSVAVDLPGARAAAVSGDGTTLYLARLEQLPGTQGPGRPRRVVQGAGDLLRPAWDAQGHLWCVDRAGGRARVSFTGGGPAAPVAVPGISGSDVRHFLVSRDGSRLVAVVHRPTTDVVLVSRILHDQRGRVVGVTRAVRIATPAGVDRVADVGWGSPTTLILLSRLDDAALVRTISVDGAPIGFDAQDVTVGARNARLVTSPSDPGPDGSSTTPRLILTDSGLVELVGSETETLPPLETGITELHYAG